MLRTKPVIYHIFSIRSSIFHYSHHQSLFSLIFSDADPYLKQCIELVASTQALKITDQFLSSKYSRSLFKACHFQSNLTTIDLSNSFIEDDGLKFLSQAIATMNQLIHLNLSGNLITANGIKHLTTMFDTQTPESILPEFTTLILSYNPLQNQSLQSLEKFCSHLNQLAVLELASTELSDFQNIDLKFSQLTHLDLSFNNFTANGIVKCIEKLNACKLKRLNLSFCGDFDTYSVYGSKQFIETLEKMLNAGNCGSLEELHLCNLDLNDTDCWQITQSIKRSKVLKIFSLRQNCQLTKVTWKLLLGNLTVQNLKLEGCRALLDNLLESDAHDVGTILQRFGNIFVSFDQDLDVDDRFEKLIRFWTMVTQHTGKIFVNHRKVLLTLNSDYCPADKWHYYQT